MVVPLPCGKLQAWRGFGAQTSAVRGVESSPRARRRAALRVALAWLAMGPTVTAQEAPRMQSDLIITSTLERIVAAPSGDAARPVPDAPDAAAAHADQLIVSVRFTNASDHVVDSIRITSAVPADVRYVAHSAGGPGSDVLFSVDNGLSFGRPNELTLAAADGSVRAADAADYTHVRWILRAPLDAGATGIARFRAVPR